MSENGRLLSDELNRLGYKPQPFSTPMRHCPGEGVKFEYRIKDGSRIGETAVARSSHPRRRRCLARDCSPLDSHFSAR